MARGLREGHRLARAGGEGGRNLVDLRDASSRRGRREEERGHEIEEDAMDGLRRRYSGGSDSHQCQTSH